jgi:hypothetical protein
MTRRSNGWRLGAAFAPLMAALGCNAILGNDDGVLYAGDAAVAPDTQVVDAHADAIVDAALDVAPDAPSCPDAGPPVDGGDAAPTLCSGGVVYVSPSGDDGRDGCTPCTAKQTITGALASLTAAAGLGDSDAGDAGNTTDGGSVDAGSLLAGMSVHVCAGTYAEPTLTLSIPVSLLGGYDCNSWSRTSTYGYPMFDAMNESIVTPASTALDSDTFRVTGAAIDSSVVVDGFTFNGTTSSTTGRAAIHVDNQAIPVISNDHVVGGSASTTMGSGGSSNGILTSEASPEITANLIEGGSGHATTGYGSIGVGVVYGSPHIHGNTIRGGSGHGVSGGSVGILATATAVLTKGAAAPIEMNSIDAGTGSAASSGGAATVGVYLLAGADVLENRIFAGAPAGAGLAYGILDKGAQSTLANDMVLAGPGHDAYPISSSGVSPFIAFNTIFGGARSDGAFVGQINLTNFANATVRDNLLLGNGVENSAGIVVDNCEGDVTSIQNNAFGNNYHGTYAVNNAGSGCYANWASGNGQGVAAMQSSLMAVGVTTSGNFGLESDCTTGTTTCTHVASCTDVPGPAADGGADPTTACLTELIAGWTAADQGEAALYGTGWTLPSTDPCPLLNAGLTLSTINVDLYGTPRPAMGSISIGAYQIPTQPTSCP